MTWKYGLKATSVRPLAVRSEALISQLSRSAASKRGRPSLGASTRSSRQRTSGMARLPPPSGEIGGFAAPTAMCTSRSQPTTSSPASPIGVSSVALKPVPSLHRMW